MQYTRSNFSVISLLSAEPSIVAVQAGAVGEPAGGSATLTCIADGVPTPSVTWFRNGVLVLTDIEDKFTISEQILPSGLQLGVPESVSSTLTILNLTAGDAAEYRCRANNDIGLATLQDDSFDLSIFPSILPIKY